MVDEHDNDVTGDRAPASREAAAGASELDRALADLRADVSVEAIRRARTSAARSRSAVTVSEMLAGCHGMTVTVHLAGDSACSGKVTEVGLDYVCIESPGGPVWAVLDTVLAVSAPVDPGSVAGTRPLSGSRLVDVLEDLALTEAEVVLTLSNGGRVAGMILATGSSVTLRDAGSFTLIQLARITKVSCPGARFI